MDATRLLDIVLPHDGWVVALAEAYIDESYREIGGVRILCVAGYLFRRQKAKEFNKSWTPYLTKQKGLPYCHMSELVHKEGIFKDRTDTDEIARRLIKETRKWTAYGFAVTIDDRMYDRLVAGKRGLPKNAYGFALLHTMIMISRWANKANFDGEISYFFEQGHAHASDAHEFLSRILKDERVRRRYRYRAHGFVPKTTPWLHPADMIAWEWSLETMRKLEVGRRPTRKGLEAVLRPGDMVMDYTSQNLADLERELEATYGGKTLVDPA